MDLMPTGIRNGNGAAGRALRAQSMPDDAERNRYLNEQRDSFRNLEYIKILARIGGMQQPTQTVNPLTGRSWTSYDRETDPAKPNYGDISEPRISQRLIVSSKAKGKKELWADGGNCWITDRNPQDIEYINFQLALARKEVRSKSTQTKEGMTQRQYEEFVSSVGAVISCLEDLGLPLSVVNTPESLQGYMDNFYAVSFAANAVKQKREEEHEQMIKSKMGFYSRSNEIMSPSSPRPKRIIEEYILGDRKYNIS